MNPLLKKLLLLALAVAGASPIFGEPPKAAPAKPVPARSVFVLPASIRDGRDPFFPDSTRPYEEASASSARPEAIAFAVKGISIEHGRAMVIINNHTFAIGDEGDVLTGGRRVHLRLVEIRTDAVVIEANGVRRVLNFATKQQPF